MARSYEVIQAEIEKLQQEAQQALDQERNEAIVRIRADMAKFGISIDELSGAVPAEGTGAAAKTRVATPPRKSVSVPSRKGAQVATTKAAETSLSAAEEESPAVRLLQDAGIDFRRKRTEAAQPPAPAKKVATTATRGARPAPARKVASKAAAKAKATTAR
jgi:hypothetical protein